jgi:hypothetical protein
MYPPVYPFLIQFLGTSFDQDLLSSASKEVPLPKGFKLKPKTWA